MQRFIQEENLTLFLRQLLAEQKDMDEERRQVIFTLLAEEETKSSSSDPSYPVQYPLEIVALVSGSTGKGDVKMIDKWIVGNDPHLGRSEAIRKRSEPEPTLKTRAKKPSVARADRMKKLTTKAIEKTIAPLAPQPVGLRLSKSAPTERLIAAHAFVPAQSKCRRKQ